MPILIRLAMHCGILCLLWKAAFPTVALPLPGDGDPLIELAFLVLLAIAIEGFREEWRRRRRRRPNRPKP